ncbi:hypothetical protein [Roseibium sediminicola]|uniref:Glycosyl transferase family 28 C-terminal domain-containing protein n=1 Tax=Roseibium sediminicola TaxID=2933272 RepID=A0ABT0H315_9HYPH|nr:hypothetical protein [Roseibium sp. CAU 1639]MCK7616051.1 hypothetical protein [Roseibium sp. CAU 1639]
MIRDRVLFLSSNGVGLGHLSRQLAIATRLSAGVVPVFHTQSYGIALVRQFGIAGLWHQHHANNGLDIEDWNIALGLEVAALEKRLEPSAIIVDSPVVFTGFGTVLQESTAQKIWVRRGFWPEQHRRFLENARWFDTIIEPADLAQEFDAGPTTDQRSEVVSVPPVLLVNPYQRQPAHAARRILDVQEASRVVALQLGNSFGDRTQALRQKLIDVLLDFPVEILDLKSPLERSQNPITDTGRVKPVNIYPSFALSKAFDAFITAPGYNSFHECILGGMPTLFVPNTAPEMDRQDLRANWSVDKGLALSMDFDASQEEIRMKIGQLLSPEFANQVSTRSDDVNWTNGALDIAALLSKQQ